MRYSVLKILGDEPVTTTEIKSHLNILTSDFDSLLDLYVTTARQYAENYLGRALVYQKIQMNLDAFPDTDYIELAMSPIVELLSVDYINSDKASVSALSLFDTDTISIPSRIVLKSGESYPTTYSKTNAITIQYYAGYDDRNNIPEIFKSAIKLMAGDMFANREDPTRNFPTLADKLLKLYRVHYYG